VFQLASAKLIFRGKIEAGSGDYSSAEEFPKGEQSAGLGIIESLTCAIEKVCGLYWVVFSTDSRFSLSGFWFPLGLHSPSVMAIPASKLRVNGTTKATLSFARAKSTKSGSPSSAAAPSIVDAKLRVREHARHISRTTVSNATAAPAA
jgi:hypothetical protein